MVAPATSASASSAPVVSREPSRRARGFNPDGRPVHHVNMVMASVMDMQTGGGGGVVQNQSAHDGAIACAVSAGVGLLDAQTPETYRQATNGPDKDRWVTAMDKEMASCAELHVWDYVALTSLPQDVNVLPVKWVYKIKTDENGEVTSFKARLTPKGFKQIKGVDFFEVYAATGMYKTKRVGLSLAAKWDHELEQLDIPTAFLNADVEEDIYMALPEGYREGHEGMVCKLRKSLYGLKQAPRNWYLLISDYIVRKMGFKSCVSDPCLYFKRSRTGRLILLFLFVDDFQGSFHAADRAEWEELKALLVTAVQLNSD